MQWTSIAHLTYRHESCPQKGNESSARYELFSQFLSIRKRSLVMDWKFGTGKCKEN